MANKPAQEIIAHQIRSLRKVRGWSLVEVQTLSKGAISAVALGSYERCDRAISLRKLDQIARFFEVPLTYFLGTIKTETDPCRLAPLVIDLRRLKALSKNPDGVGDATLISLTTLVTSIAHRRGDWNAEVMSLRQGDLSTLSLITMKTEEELMKVLTRFRLLLTRPNHP